MAVIALASGMFGGLMVLGLHGVSHPSDNARRTDPAQEAGPALPIADREAGPTAGAIDAITSRLGQLSEKIDMLGGRIERLETTRPEPPAELDDLREQVGRLNATTSELALLPGEFKQIDGRVASLSETLIRLNDALAALRAKAESPASPTTPQLERSPGADAPPTTDSVRAMAQGMKLFKQSRYKEALALFNILELTTPDDARVWYFAALSHGFYTGEWNGVTERLVEKGIERERAGTPGGAAIDSAFNDLTSSQGREWLAEYRRRVTRPPGSASPPLGVERR